jgi:replication-associated recombination protein RarA
MTVVPKSSKGVKKMPLPGKEKKIKLQETEALLRFSGGDARKLLNMLELLISTEAEEWIITNAMVRDVPVDASGKAISAVPSAC